MVPFNVILEKTKEVLPILEKKYNYFTSPKKMWEENLQTETFTFFFSIKEPSMSSIEGNVYISRNTIVLRGSILTPSFSEEIKYLFFKKRKQKRMLEKQMKRLKKLLNYYFSKMHRHRQLKT